MNLIHGIGALMICAVAGALCVSGYLIWIIFSDLWQSTSLKDRHTLKMGFLIAFIIFLIGSFL